MRIGPGVPFHAIFIAGPVFSAVAPAVATGDWKTAQLRDTALGLLA